MSQHEYTSYSKQIKLEGSSSSQPAEAANGSSSSYTEREPLISPSSSSYYGAIRPVGNNHLPEQPQHITNQSRWRKTFTYIVISIVLPIVLLLTFIFWFAPIYAERSVDNGVTFEFKRASILNFTEDSVIHMHISGDIGLRPSLYNLQQSFSKVFGAIGVQQSNLRVHYQRYSSPSAQLLMSSDELSMGTVDLPSLQLNHTSNVTSFDFITRFVIDDTDALMDFCRDAVNAKTILWRISGPLSMNVEKLPWNLNAKLDKIVALEGMDGLKKNDLQSLMFPGPHALGGIAVTGTVGIYNPSSVLSFSLGDVDFGIYLPAEQQDKNDTQIAVVRANKANLEGQQMNYFNVSGRTLPINNDDASQRSMETFLTRYLHGNTTLVNVRGSSFGPDDIPSKKHVGNVPHWLQKALESISLHVPFPGAKETQLIQSLELKDIKIDFSKEGDPLISGNAIAMLKKPEEMQFHMDVTEIDPHVFLYLNLDSEKPFASVQPIQPCPATTEEGNGIDLPLQTMRVKSKLVRAPFKVLPGGQKDFENFLHKVFYGKKGTIYIRGTSDATVDSDFGHLNVKDLDFNGEIETKGLQGMQYPPPQVTSMTISKGYKDALYVKTELDIYSPADVDINLGELNMALLYNDHLIGNTSIPELKLLPEVSNKLLVSAWLFGDNAHVIEFIGDYISKGMNSSSSNVTLTISGQHNNATRSAFLKEFLKRIRFNVQAPPFNEEPLLADCRMNILSSTVIMSLRNPFPGVEMTIKKINASATYDYYEIGTMVANFEDRGEGWKNGPLKLPPPSCANELKQCESVIVESEKIPITTGKLGYEAIKKALGGSIEVSVASKVSVMIDNFKLDNLRYQQNNITTKVRKGF